MRPLSLFLSRQFDFRAIFVMAVSPLTSLFAITARASDVVVQSLQVANCTAGAACKCGDGLIWGSVSACRCQEGLDTSRTRTNTLRPAPGCQGRGAACQHQHNQAFEPLQYCSTDMPSCRHDKLCRRSSSVRYLKDAFTWAELV